MSKILKNFYSTYFIIFFSAALSLISIQGLANDKASGSVVKAENTLENTVSSSSDLRALAKKLTELKPFSSSYKQTLSGRQGEILEKAEGQFILGKNKAFKNIIEKPDNSVIVSNGNKLWMMDHDLEQVTVNYLDDFLQDTPLVLMLDDPKKSLASFSVREKAHKKLGQVLYFLQAKDPQASISRVRISFKDSFISYLELDERSGNTVRINFYEIKNLDLATSKDLFTIIIPSVYDIIDETL